MFPQQTKVFTEQYRDIKKYQHLMRPHDLPLFRIKKSVLDAADMDTIRATWNDMYQMGLYPDPFPMYSIEVNGSFVAQFSKQEFNTDPSVIESSGIADTRWIFEYVSADAKGNYSWDLTCCYDGLWKRFSLAPDYVSGSGDTNDYLAELSKYMRSFFLTILVTKNIEKKEVENSLKSKKHQQREDAKYFSRTTTINIGKITETFKSEGGGGGTVRPHLRRGHIRRQHYGKNNSEVKTIFIAPTFVSADAGWIDAQKKYNVTV